MSILAASVFAATQGPLACFYYRDSTHRIYMLHQQAEQYLAMGGALSEQKPRSFGRNYVCAEQPELVLEKLSGAEAVPIELADGATFLFPTNLATVLACRLERRVTTDARSIRKFILFWLPILEALRTAPSPGACEQVVTAHIMERGLTPHAIRVLRNAGWQLKISEHFDRMLAAHDIESGTESAASSVATPVSFESGSSRISFIETVGATGEATRRRDIALLLFEHDHEWLQARCNGRALLLEGLGLHSIHDLAVAAEVLGRERCDALEVIDLASNQIADIPSELFRLFPRLTTVVLRGNPLREIAPDAFSAAPALATLDLSRCGLTALPATLFDSVASLERLILTDNELGVLPSVAACAHLRLLALQNNHLTDLPDMSACAALEVLDVSDNLLTTASEHLLPEATHSALQSLTLRGNNITTFTPGFLRRVPAQGETDLRDNPVWADTAQVAVLVDEERYQRIDVEDVSFGRALAGQVREAVYTDTREKLCEYLLSNRLLTQSVICDEIRRQRALGHIATASTDAGLWVYRNGHWVTLAGIIVGSVVGGGTMLFLMWSSEAVASWVVGGGLLGGAVGGVVSYLGYDYSYDGGRQFYLNSGSDTSVYMSSEMSDAYTGTYRLIVLLSVLKQYLIACNTCLYWLTHFDELLDAGQSVESVMDRLDSLLHLTSAIPLARPSGAGCVVLLSELLSSDSLGEARAHAPVDLFPAATMGDQPLAHHATYPFFGVEKLTLVRAALCRFSGVARTLRAALMNRYIGTRDHHHILATIGELDLLRTALEAVQTDVLTPTCLGMGEAGHLTSVWYSEVYHLYDVVRDTLALFTDLEVQAAVLYGT
jgi:hypothetical protein